MYLARLGAQGPEIRGHRPQLPGKPRPKREVARIDMPASKCAGQRGLRVTGYLESYVGPTRPGPTGGIQHAEPLHGADVTPHSPSRGGAGLLLMALLPSPVRGSGRTDHVLG